MTTANIVFLIDPQNGFANPDLTPEQGGSLYVPSGENVGEPSARLIRNLENSYIVYSQDFHPAGHISFASSHQNVKPYQKIYLLNSGFDFRATAVVADDGAIWPVDVDEKGCITKVDYNVQLTEKDVRGCVEQTLWLDHCIQGTYSSLFVDSIMHELPTGLAKELRSTDSLAHTVLSDSDIRGNTHYVVRKGMEMDLDSYGISTENDGILKTDANSVFKDIADDLQNNGVKEVNIFVGGLATNFCVEFSHKDICEEFVPMLAAKSIKANVYLLTDISAGIPLEAPDGKWPDLTSASARMAAYGTETCTTDDVIRGTLKGRAAADLNPKARLEG